jgi:SAM-dependent methyltransferase
VLLSRAGAAAWVLFKIDGGVDHILVDEAQDTNPEQWSIIERLAEEFFAGEGASDTLRTLFAVGDEKQSIYSFQGADPVRFGTVGRAFRAKATAIADCVGPTGRVVGLDKHPRRLALVAREARRLGVDDERLELRTCDVANGLPDEAPAGSFDRVLVDAPCSGLGTLRRNADLRWRVEPGDPGKLAATQRALLAAAARALRPGGALVYSTCTLTAEENEAVVQDFLAKTPGFRLAAPEALPECVRPVVAGGFLRTLPHRHGTDGFFAARLERDA